MTIFVVTPPEISARRSDGKNTFVLSAASAAAAKTAAEILTGDVAGTFTAWLATALTDTPTQDFVVESHNGPVGRKAGTAWSQLTRGGSPLAA